jgi:hypothetical protein
LLQDTIMLYDHYVHFLSLLVCQSCWVDITGRDETFWAGALWWQWFNQKIFICDIKQTTNLDFTMKHSLIVEGNIYNTRYFHSHSIWGFFVTNIHTGCIVDTLVWIKQKCCRKFVLLEYSENVNCACDIHLFFVKYCN